MAVPPLPADTAGQIAYIQTERQRVIQPLLLKSRKLGKVPDPNEEPVKSLLPRLDALLTRLETQIQMTSEMKRATKIGEALELIFMPVKNFCFSNEHMERARRLHEKYENLSTAPRVARPAASAVKEEEDEDAIARPKKRQKSTSHAEPDNKGSYIKPPPVDHPIWGVDGIMHGLALKKFVTGRKSTVLNPEYENEKKEAGVFGHNDLQVGSWFPNRLSALFHGAHGHSQAGIHGNPDSGAFSIVVSGLYELLDQDKGDILFYSGSGSHDNTDPDQPAEATSGTRALHKSMETRRPVRVLRTKESGSVYRPSEGLRYDGLYGVVSTRIRKNTKRGAYEQFELRRLPENDVQCSLSTCRSRPSARELRDYNKIEYGYESRK